MQTGTKTASLYCTGYPVKIRNNMVALSIWLSIIMLLGKYKFLLLFLRPTSLSLKLPNESLLYFLITH